MATVEIVAPDPKVATSVNPNQLQAQVDQAIATLATTILVKGDYTHWPVSWRPPKAVKAPADPANRVQIDFGGALFNGLTLGPWAGVQHQNYDICNLNTSGGLFSLANAAGMGVYDASMKGPTNLRMIQGLHVRNFVAENARMFYCQQVNDALLECLTGIDSPADLFDITGCKSFRVRVAAFHNFRRYSAVHPDDIQAWQDKAPDGSAITNEDLYFGDVLVIGPATQGLFIMQSDGLTFERCSSFVGDKQAMSAQNNGGKAKMLNCRLGAFPGAPVYPSCDVRNSDKSPGHIPLGALDGTNLAIDGAGNATPLDQSHFITH